LARAGMDVVLAARRVDTLEPTVEEIMRHQRQLSSI
jgi:NADP-dependent 3-hydroxy acid dehydrogenase YdfG